MRKTQHLDRALRALLPALLPWGLGLLAAATHAAGLPATRVTDVADTLHGTIVRDPYRWLEDVRSPEVRSWLQAQGDYATTQLAAIPGRDAMLARIEALSQATGDAVRGLVRMPGQRLYYLKREARGNQFKLMLRTGLDAANERVLVDPQRLADAAGGVPHAINYFAPSWDGKYLAYGVSAGGSEAASLYILDVATGQNIGEPVPRVHEPHVSWTPDSQAVVFNQVRALPPGTPDTETFLDTGVFLLRVGDKPSQARAIFGPLVQTELKLDRLDVGQVLFAPGSAWMVARTTDTTVPEGKLFIAPVSALKGPNIAWRQISRFDDRITDLALQGDQLYLRTYAKAPRGKVVVLNLRQPDLARARTVAEAPPMGVIESFSLGKRGVYTTIRSGFTVRTFHHTGGRATDVAPQLTGSTRLVDDAAAAYDDLLLQTNSWTQPTRVLALPAGTARNAPLRDTGLANAQVPAGVPELEVTSAMVPSHDGVPVPVVVLHRKGLERTGNAPTLLNAYGAYGLTIEGRFDPRAYAWLERGGVLAYGNVRGSGAYGDAWHRAGFKATKSNTWKDGIAIARWLIAQRYTSPQQLGISGTSAGGIFVGRAVTTAPELFAAAIFNVGVMDAVRAEDSANGITNTSEFGSYRDAAELPALLDMSTYHQIQDGKAYPAVMLVHGINDPRVDVWHSAKAAARLQAASTSGKPILLRLDGQAGHGIGSTARQGYSQQADIYSFLLWQFGLAR